MNYICYLNNLNMKKIYKSISIAFLGFCAIAQMQAQTFDTIPKTNPAGTGASTTIHRKPLGSNRAYERSAMKYTHQEIGMFGTITAIGFYCDTILNPGTTPVKVYIKEVLDSSFTASSVAIEEAGAILVFNDTLHTAAFVKDSFATIILTTPFLHATTNNIEVIVETNSGGTAGTDATTLAKGFRYYTVGTNRFEYWQSGTGSGVIPAGNGTLNSNRPNIRLTMAPAAICTAPPTAGLAVANPASVCSGSTTSLSLSGNSTGTSMSYQWLSSTNGGVTWSPIAGATSNIYNDTVNAPISFKCVLTCSGLTDTSAATSVSLNPFYQCYCTQGIGGNCATSAIDSVAITSTTLSNGHTGCSTNSYVAYPASGSTTASVIQGQVYSLNTKFTGNVRAIVWIDYNQNGVFEPNEYNEICLTSTANTNVVIPIFIPANATTGLTGMRIRTHSATGTGTSIDSTTSCAAMTSGETEDYIINILAASPCTAPPTAGTTIASQTAVCAGTIVTLSLNGNSNGSGMTFQWQSSTNGGTSWNNIIGATLPLYSDTIYTAISYQCVITCSSLSATSTPVNITVNPFYQCYCTQGLGGGCTTSAIDSVGFTGTTLLNGSTGCSTGNYMAYQATGNTTTSLHQASTYTLNTIFTGTVKAGVWIDYNHDGTFEPSEYTSICTTSAAGTNIATSITIPLTALIGVTGMRVRSRASTSTLDSTSACTTFGSGETEDYIVTIDIPFGIKEYTQLLELNVFPNPTNGVVTISSKNAVSSHLTIQVMNIEGEKVYNENSGVVNGSINMTIDLSSFAKGFYFIRVITDKETTNKKISLQ